MRSHTDVAQIVAIAVTLLAPAAAHAQVQTDKPFVSGGSVNIQLEGGEYEIKPATDNHLRVTFGGKTGSAVAELTTNDKQADIKIRNTPLSGNFRATIEIPKMSNLVLRLSGGDLSVDAFTGNKDIEVTAGDVKIAVGDPNDYAAIDASVKVGDLSGGPLGDANGSFLSHSINRSGKGKYRFHATLGAGDLKLR